jgi:PIN domain nuclease of toxin-antitoxin system
MSEYVLDACALLALLCDEVGADVVARAINAANRGEVNVKLPAPPRKGKPHSNRA